MHECRAITRSWVAFQEPCSWRKHALSFPTVISCQSSSARNVTCPHSPILLRYWVTATVMRLHHPTQAALSHWSHPSPLILLIFPEPLPPWSLSMWSMRSCVNSNFQRDCLLQSATINFFQVFCITSTFANCIIICMCVCLYDLCVHVYVNLNVSTCMPQCTDARGQPQVLYQSSPFTLFETGSLFFFFLLIA